MGRENRSIQEGCGRQILRSFSRKIFSTEPDNLLGMRQQTKRTRCLIIDEPFVNLILNGNKTWEIRRRNTKIRERIALGNKTMRCAVGYARIVDCQELTVEELKQHNDKHQANDLLDKYANGRKTLFAWVLEEVKPEPNPKLTRIRRVHGAGCKNENLV